MTHVSHHVSHNKGFTSHQTVARTAGNVLLRLADSILLPFKCSDYAEMLEQYLKEAMESFEADLKVKNISMGTNCIITRSYNILK